jgi:hypothetical protein
MERSRRRCGFARLAFVPIRGDSGVFIRIGLHSRPVNISHNLHYLEEGRQTAYNGTV